MDGEEISVERPDYDTEREDPSLLMTRALQRLDTITDHQGYMYCLNRTVADVRYLRCTKFKNGCTGRAIMRGYEVEQTNPHNHRADPRRVAVRKFTKEFILEAQDRRGRNLRAIYDHVCRRLPKEAVHVSYKAAYRSLHRASLKMAQLPPMSQLLLEEEEDISTDEEEETEMNEELNSNNEGEVSELLPGPKGQPLYYDGVGYYFIVTGEDSAQRWLQCSHAGCSVFGFMELWHGAPVTLLEGGGHNHPPNTQRRQRILFLHDIKTRYLHEPAKPFAHIFQEEAAKNPIGASFFSRETIEECLKRKTNQNQSDNRPTTDAEPEPKRRKVDSSPIRPSKVKQVISSTTKEDIPSPAKLPAPTSAPAQWERVPALFGADWLYHDLAGHYYRALTHTPRELVCVEPKCGASATVPTASGASLVPRRPHHHLPRSPRHRARLWFVQRLRQRARQAPPDILLSQLYHDQLQADSDQEGAEAVPEHEALRLLHLERDIQTQEEDEPIKEENEVASEKLPSPDLSECQHQYHDGRGYYYTVDGQQIDTNTNTDEDIVWLRCVSWPLCGGRGWMAGHEGAPITSTTRHSHPSDLTHRLLCLFSATLKRRARDEATPLTRIYNEEALRYPEAAAALDQSLVLSRLLNIRTMMRQRLGGTGCTGTNPDLDLIKEDGRMEAVSEAVEGPRRPVYHDGNGYYFLETFTTDTHRHLMCSEPDCLAQAEMGLAAGASVTREAGSEPHSHAPDPLRLSALRLLATLRHSVRTCPNATLDALYHQHTSDCEEILLAQLNKDSTLKMMKDIRTAGRQGSAATSNVEDNEIEVEEAGLWDGAVPARRVASTQHQTWLVYDGRGYRYHSRLTSHREWLLCCEEGCDARAWLEPETDAIVRRDPGCVLHNHLPREDGTAKSPEDKNTQVVDQYFKDCVSVCAASPDHGLCTKDSPDKNRAAVDTEPYEVLQAGGPDCDEPVYCDGRGFYYHSSLQHQSLVCVRPVCAARARLLSAARLSAPSAAAHSHPPDPSLHYQLLFIHNLRSRLLSPTPTPLSVDTVYSQEAAREPIGAARSDEATVKNLMHKWLKSKRVQELPVDSVQSDWTDDTPDTQSWSCAEDGDQPLKGSNNEDSAASSRSEKLPSRSNNVVYHDGQGYYFHFNTVKEHIMYLCCAEPQCKVRAWKPLTPEDAPILLTRDSPVHNHRADLSRRRQFLLLHRCKLRAATETLPLQQIWDSEAQRDPDTAALVSEANVKSQMRRYRQEHGLLETSRAGDNSTEGGNIYQDPSVVDFLANENWQSSVAGMLDVHGGQVPDQVPSPSGQSLWHAAGYLYTVYHIIGHLHKAKCIEKGCSARCQITLTRGSGQEPSIRLNKNTAHNHPPDTRSHDQLLFIHRCKRLATRSSKTIQQIYSEQAAKEPEVAAGLSETKVKQAMKAAKREHMKKLNCKIDEMTEENDDTGDGECGSEKSVDMMKGPAADRAGQSECLLCQEDGTLIFHDLQGYLYQETSIKRDKRLLKCIDCEVRAQMALHPLDAAIVLLNDGSEALHNHEPDLSRMGRIVRGHVPNGTDEVMPPPGPDDTAPEASLTVTETVPDPEQSYTDYVTLDEEDADDNELKSEESPRLYHDGNGYYYSLQCDDNRRYLQCSDASCGVVVTLAPDDKPLTKLYNTCATHPHPPDLSCRRRNLFLKQAAENLSAELEWSVNGDQLLEEDPGHDDANLWDESTSADNSMTIGEELSEFLIDSCSPAEKKLKEMDSRTDSHVQLLPSEVMPGLRPNSTVYHDGRGYYFIFNTFKNNKRYVRCMEPRCRVRGSMEAEDGAPIMVSPGSIHNHRPDFKRKNYVLFVQRCKERAMAETTPLQEIYDQEVASDPVSAALISQHNLVQRMLRARKLSNMATPQGHFELAEACHSGDFVDDSQDEAKFDEDVDAALDDNHGDEEELESAAIEEAISQLANTSAEGDDTPTTAEGEQLPSEMLPGVRPQSVMYHDGRGYYYIFNSQRENVWYLKCIEPQCRVRAHMAPHEGSPIVLRAHSLHNHRPDLRRKRLVLWMEETLQRAVSETLPISTIYAQQAARDSVSASLVFKENMKTRMYRARKAAQASPAQNGGEREPKSELSVKSETVTPYRPSFCDNNGYCYQQTTVRNSVRYLKCVEPGCKARASTPLEPSNSGVALSRLMPAHNHEPVYATQFIYTDDNGEQVALCQLSEEPQLLSPLPPKRPYRQRQQPELTIDPEEVVDSTATASEEDVAAGEYYHTEDQQKFPLKPSEVIPGLRPDANNYHDGNGFYYELNRLSQNIRYLKCLIKDCKARAYMEVGKKNAPIIQTNFAKHNHGPDLFRKQFTVFLHRVTRRAANEDTPINVIYDQEAARDPQSAGQIRMENVKQRMMRFRKKHRQQRNAFHNVQDVDSVTLFKVEGGGEYSEDDGMYYILDEGEGYVISEVEVESSSQHQL